MNQNPITLSGLLGLLTLVSSAALAEPELHNLRQNCARWQLIPANEALGSPAAALLECSDETENIWLSLQLICLDRARGIAVRYRPGYPVTLPYFDPTTPGSSPEDRVAQDEEVVFEVAAPQDVVEPVGSHSPVAGISLMFPGMGFHHSGHLDGDRGDWVFEISSIHYPAFDRLASGSYVDVLFDRSEITERLPLRGSGKAIRRVLRACKG